MVKVIIHRGTRTIGGSCVEIQSGTYRLIIDLGLPLMARDGVELDATALQNPSVENGIMPDVAGLYSNDIPTVTAAILSHAHIDHYGLMNQIHPAIPVYMGKESQKLIEVVNMFLSSGRSQQKPIKHLQTFNHWEPFTIGPFTVTSYLMDHSAFGSSSFLIEVGGRRIFYSGDFRGHGRKGKLFDNLVKKGLPKIDCLVMEGTTLGGNHSVGYHSEDEVEEGLCQVFTNQEDASFVMAASSNVDRTVSIYRAAIRAHKTLVLDLFQYHLLKQLQTFAPGLPPHDRDGLSIYYLKSHADAIVKNLGRQILINYHPHQVKIEEIRQNRREMVFRIPLSGMRRIAKQLQQDTPLGKAHFIYSMWSGYLEREPQFQQFCETYSMPKLDIHTSGHAYSPDLKRLAEALKPKALLAIHTLSGDDFQHHFSNVVRISDGKPFEIPD